MTDRPDSSGPGPRGPSPGEAHPARSEAHPARGESRAAPVVPEPANALRAMTIAPEPPASLALVPVPGASDAITARDVGPSDAAILRGDVDAWGRSEHIRSLVRAAYSPIYRYWFRAEWEGLEHVPREGGALLVANHAAAIPSDAPVIMHGIETELGRPVYGLAEYLFRALPVVGTLWSRNGGVAANPDNAYRLLHDDEQLVLVFPEGAKATGKHYRDRYKLRRFGRGGFVEIAMRSGAPVVPIAVVGAEESMPIVWKSRRLAALLNIPYFPVTANMLAFGPLGTILYLPAKFRLRVLPPVHFDVPPDQERYSRSRVMAASDKIREHIQTALYDMLRVRRSVWFG